MFNIFCTALIGTGLLQVPAITSITPAYDEVLSDIHTDNILVLPSNTIPSSYDLQLKVYLPEYGIIPSNKTYSLDGTVKIRFTVISETNLITLNSVNLKILSYNLTSVLNNKVSANIHITSFWDQSESDWLHFQTQRRLFPGEQFELQIAYSGKFFPDSQGLSFVYYKDGNIAKKTAAISNFNPIAARTIVPCYDEPSLKATWKIKLIHPTGTSALCNQKMDKTNKNPTDGNFTDTSFLETPKIPASSVQFAILDMTKTIKTDVVTYTIYTRNHIVTSQAQFALDNLAKSMKFCEANLGSKYALSKMDIIARPEFDYEETSLGLLTFGEYSIFYDTKLHSSADRLEITRKIAQNTATQWFGNIVSMEWWSERWLTDCLATIMGNSAADSISNGAFRMFDRFLVEYFVEALEEGDDMALTRKLSSISDIYTSESGVLANKAAAIVLMIRNLMGADNFLKGIKSFATKYSNQSSDSLDFFEELNSAVPTNVTGPNGTTIDLVKFIPQWIFQKGYPLVTLEHVNTSMIRVTQQRSSFQNSGTAISEQNQFGYKWDVPLWIQRGKSDPVLYWLTRDSPLFLQDAGQIAILNANGNSLVRQNYSPRDWQMISSQLQMGHLMFSNRTRAILIADSFAMAAAGKLDYDTLFSMMTYIRKETNYLPLFAFEREFQKVLQNYDPNSEGYKAAQDYHGSLLKPMYSSYLPTSIAQTYLNDSKIYDSQRDELIFRSYCSITDSCAELRTIYQQQVDIPCNTSKTPVASSCATVTPSLRKTVYCREVKNNETAFNTLLSFYQRETAVKEKENLLSALACSQDMNNLIGLLNTVTDSSSQLFELKDSVTVFNGVARNKAGSGYLLDYLINNWTRLFSMLSSKPGILSSVAQSCLANVRSQADIVKLQNFMRSTLTTYSFDFFNKALLVAQQRLDWQTRNLETLRNIFRRYTLS